MRATGSIVGRWLCVLAVAGLLVAAASLLPGYFGGTGRASPDIVSVPCGQVRDVAVFSGQRLHVHCSIQGIAGRTIIEYFALPTDDSSAALILNLLQTALTSGKPLFVLYESDASANPPGCLVENCRRMVGVVLGP